MQKAYFQRLRKLREDRDYTQKQIADMLGVAQSTYSQYELGRRALPIELFVKLCRFYKVSADDILGLKKP